MSQREAQVIGRGQFRGQREPRYSEQRHLHLALSPTAATKLILTLFRLCFSSSRRQRRIDTFNADGGILVKTVINRFYKLSLAFKS